jgi:hypothetical protein
MWTILLPVTVPGRISHIWRSYFAQCIFVEAGLSLIFATKDMQERYAHDYLKDFNADQALYTNKKNGKLIEFLSEWDSKDADTIPKRMEDLWIDLGAVDQAGCKFPPLKRNYRNVAVIGQFNYVNKQAGRC